MFKSNIRIFLVTLLLLLGGCTANSGGEPQATAALPGPTVPASPSPFSPQPLEPAATTAFESPEMMTPLPTTFDAARLGTVQRNLTYCTSADGVDLTMDVHYPASGSAPFPAVLYVHGGSWLGGDKSEGTRLPGRTELVDGGNLFVSINYRLAPQHRFPAQIEDVKCAVRALRANAPALGLDPARIAAMGASAGGHLVSLLGLSDEGVDWDAQGGYTDQSSRVSAVVDIFGPTVPEGDLGPRERETLQRVFGTDDLNDPLIQAASPSTHISPDDPPFLILHGTLDDQVPVQQSRRFAELLQQAGIPAELIILEGEGHGLPSRSADLLAVMLRMRAFLNQHIGPPANQAS